MSKALSLIVVSILFFLFLAKSLQLIARIEDSADNLIRDFYTMPVEALKEKNADKRRIEDHINIENDLREAIRKKDNEISQLQHRLDFMTSHPERRSLEDKLENIKQKRLLFVDRLKTLGEKQSLIDRVDTILAEGNAPVTRAERDLRDKLILSKIIQD